MLYDWAEERDRVGVETRSPGNHDSRAGSGDRGERDETRCGSDDIGRAFQPDRWAASDRIAGGVVWIVRKLAGAIELAACAEDGEMRGGR